MEPARAAEVLDFWFGAEPVPRDEWFRKDTAFDARIGAHFGRSIEDALAGRLAAWERTSHGALARVLLLDQFTRNAFRNSARAFAGDTLALAGAREMVARGDDLAVPPLQRLFVYLPFEHSEDRAAQAESLHLFAALSRAAPALAGYEDYARRHAAVIERFGRFPHRNEALGRATTVEETALLQQPGSRF